MPHYKNGREAKVGDPVIGTVFNTKGTIAGTLLSVTSGSDACSCLVGFIATHPKGAPAPNMAKQSVPIREHGSEQHGSSGLNQQSYWCEDYTECKHLYHADNALEVTQRNIIPKGWRPPPPLEADNPTGPTTAA